MKPTFPPPGFLIGLAATALAAYWSGPAFPAFDFETVAPVHRPDQNDSPRNTLPPVTDVDAALSAVASRPLLAENRQSPILQAEPVPQAEPEPEPSPPPPPEPEVEPPAPPAPPVPNVEAVGLMLADSQPRILIRNMDSGEETWVIVGEQINGWTLVEITQVAAVLEAQGVQMTIPLYKDTLP